LVVLLANLLIVTVPLANQGDAPAVRVDISLTEQLAMIVLPNLALIAKIAILEHVHSVPLDILFQA
jgi:hypothetical protein